MPPPKKNLNCASWAVGQHTINDEVSPHPNSPGICKHDVFLLPLLYLHNEILKTRKFHVAVNWLHAAGITVREQEFHFYLKLIFPVPQAALKLEGPRRGTAGTTPYPTGFF